MFEPARDEGNGLKGPENADGLQLPLGPRVEGETGHQSQHQSSSQHSDFSPADKPHEAAGAGLAFAYFHGPHAHSYYHRHALSSGFADLVKDSEAEDASEADHTTVPEPDSAVANHSHMDTGFADDRFSVDSVAALDVDDPSEDPSETPAEEEAVLSTSETASSFGRNSARNLDSPIHNRIAAPRTVTGPRTIERHVGQSPILQAVITLCMLACTLAAARYWVPSIIEEGRYAWRRGQLRADYEASGEGLSAVGMDSLAMAYQMVTQRVAPSVVHIEVIKTQDFEQSDIRSIARGEPFGIPTSDQGSGVVVSEDGYIVTNDHVVSGGNVITVGLSDGRRVRGQVVGTDPLTDLALLKIDAEGLTPIQWADSDEAEVGTPVWAIGSPFGLDRTVTFGILSGKHRAAKAGTSYQDFMQSDVAVNPGNSGGPLVDGRGRLVGINTAIVGETYRGVSFSIPSNVAQRVYERLRKSGKFERGWLGVELAEVSDREVPGQDFRVRGAKVRALVDPTSPAAKAGLTSGDIIVRFDGDDVSDQGALMRMVGNWPAGQTAVLDVIRNGLEKSISVEIGTRPNEYNLR